jgi:hypothetical protein
LGQAVFSNGKEVLDFKLEPGNATTFKHRVVIVSGSKLDQETLDNKFKSFSAE